MVETALLSPRAQAYAAEIGRCGMGDYQPSLALAAGTLLFFPVVGAVIGAIIGGLIYGMAGGIVGVVIGIAAGCYVVSVA